VTAHIVYIASPLGFSQVGRRFYYEELLPTIRELGYDVLDPWTSTNRSAIDRVVAMPYGPERRDAWRRLNSEIGLTNRDAIDRADAVVAVLDGTDVDSGTAAEIGYACARGKLIIGYRGDVRPSGDNEGGVVNLQVEYFVRASGGTIVPTISDIGRELKQRLQT
jgi:nucleoside 2-deoxyribosyltransferase